MTCPIAIHQFIAMCGASEINKGSVFVEPLRDEGVPISRIIGQCDYLATAVSGRQDTQINPYPQHTGDAQCWAAGKLIERRWERSAVAALQAEARRMA